MTKVDLISGFLGAGKTTLIAKLIKDVYANEKVVLVENEFGEIGIDGGFLKDAGIVINEINSGCICCTLEGDFQEALQKVVDQYAPERIVIEPSGVGKLSDIITAVKEIEGLTINSASTVVDTKKCKLYSKNFKEFFNDQIEAASCVVLSKTQMTTDEKLEETLAIVKEINPKAKVVTTNWDELDGKTLMSVMEGSFTLLDEKEHHHHHHHHDEDEECCCEHEHDEECECHHHHDDDEECCCEHHHDEECECHHHHDDEECECHHHHDEDEECCCGHDHDEECDCHHHHDDDEECECGHHHHHHHHHGHDADEIFDSIGFETIKKFSSSELEEILAKLPENIIRCKGIVSNVNGGWLFFDFVPGDIDVREGSAAYTGLITIIGTEVDVQASKELFGVK